MILSTYCSIQNMIVEDNLVNSKYKKAFSRFDFEDTQSVFFATKADMSLNANGQNDIKAIIDIVPICIYLDQFTLKFLLDFFYYNQIDIASLSNTKNDYHEDNQDDIILETQTVSQINPIQYKQMPRLNKSINRYSFSKLIINSFFINFNYFPRKFNFYSTDEAANYELFNLVTIENMNIALKEVKILSSLTLDKAGAYLVEYWKNDIKDNQILRSLLKAIPIMRNFNNVFSGFVSMANIPLSSFEKDIPIEESLVDGVRCFVASTSSELLKFGESVTGFFKRIGRVQQTNDNGFRQLLYKINSLTKKRDEYYLKAG